MRADGKRLKNTDPMYTVAAHIMNRRTDALNMATIDIPIDTIQPCVSRDPFRADLLSSVQPKHHIRMHTVLNHKLELLCFRQELSLHPVSS